MILLMNDNGLTELEVEKDGMRIKLKKSSGGSFEKAIEFVTQASAPPSPQETKIAK